MFYDIPSFYYPLRHLQIFMNHLYHNFLLFIKIYLKSYIKIVNCIKRYTKHLNLAS